MCAYVDGYASVYVCACVYVSLCILCASRCVYMHVFASYFVYVLMILRYDLDFHLLLHFYNT